MRRRIPGQLGDGSARFGYYVAVVIMSWVTKTSTKLPSMRDQVNKNLIFVLLH